MALIDWLILLAFFAFTLWDGLRTRENQQSVEGLLLARRSMPWWAVGFSVIATQASAITFIGTTGLAYMEDMRFLQVYFAMPVAMVILCVTLLPLYHRLKVFTAYEALEGKFGLPVRLSASFLFLLSRGLTLGVTIAAPAYVLALVFDLPLQITILVIGAVATAYTMVGGITGVIRTDVKQMALMLIGLAVCFFWIWGHLPEGLGFGSAMQLASATDKLHLLDFHFDPAEKYNIWTGVIASLFLMLSYFGADQSQVQRYLSSRSLADARLSLIFPALVKIPMQFFILLLGVMLYVFFQFAERPMLFLPGEHSAPETEQRFRQLQSERSEAAMHYLDHREDREARVSYRKLDLQLREMRQDEFIRREKEEGDIRNDTNYVLPWFVLHHLPAGVVGLIIAAILAAALSSIDSMLNSLAASSVMDWYRRLYRGAPDPGRDLHLTRLATVFWGIVATLSALAFGETESILELVNRLGSYFYGPILGLFILLFVPGIRGAAALVGLGSSLLLVMVLGSVVESFDTAELSMIFPLAEWPRGYVPIISYLWLNPIGAIAATGIAVLWQRISDLGAEAD